MIELTPSAVRQIQALQAQQADETARLRFYLEEGGCSGWEYAMGFGAPAEGDERLSFDGVELFVPTKDLPKLQGVEIHFDDGLQGKGFEIRNPNAQATCGCGRSFN